MSTGLMAEIRLKVNTVKSVQLDQTQLKWKENKLNIYEIDQNLQNV